MISIEALIKDILDDPLNKDLTPLEIGAKIDELFEFTDVKPLDGECDHT